MGASFGDMAVGMLTRGVEGGANAYEKVMERQQAFTMQQMLEESKALREEHMAEVSKLNAMEINKANIENQAEAEKSAWGVGGYRTKADEAAHGPGGYATRGKIEVNEKQGEMQIKVAKAAAGIAATAKGRETASAIAQIKSLGLSPEQEQRAIVAEITKLDLLNPKNGLSTQYSSIYRANSALVDNDPAYEKASAAEKAAAADTMTKIQLGQTLSTGVVEDELGSVIALTSKPVAPTAAPVPAEPRRVTPPVKRGLLSSPTSSQAPYELDTEKIINVGKGALGGAREVFSNTSASELGRNAKENVKRWTGIK